MNDCPNAEMRDRLPDLLHERLDASTRAVVVAHVDACEDCRAELALLRDMRGMMAARTPRVDVSYVVGGLPLPKHTATVAARAGGRRRWADWRIAAAVTVLAVGGTSVVVLQRAAPGSAPISSVGSGGTQPGASATRTAPTAAEGSSAQVAAAPPVSSVPAAASKAGSRSAAGTPANASTASSTVASTAGENTGIGMTGHLSDLSERQLKSLLDGIDQLKAVPITEPDPVDIKVGGTTSSSSSEGL